MQPIKISPNGPVTEFLPDLDACEGKTIASVRDESPSYSDYRIIRFTDASAIAFYEMADGGYQLGGATFEGRFNRRERVYFGMESADIYAKDEAAQEAADAAERESQERARYEALKTKYGP